MFLVCLGVLDAVNLIPNFRNVGCRRCTLGFGCQLLDVSRQRQRFEKDLFSEEKNCCCIVPINDVHGVCLGATC